MKSNQDIIIIGGGIIGLACAHYLIGKNKRVRIIEQERVGSGASHGNCGLLLFSGIIPLCSPGVVTHEIYRTIRRSSPLHIQPRFDVKLWQWLAKFACSCTVKHQNAAATAKSEISKYSIGLFDALLSDIDMDCDGEKKGYLTLFKDRAALKKYAATNSFLNRYDLGGRSLNQSQTQALEPAVRDNIPGSFFNPHVQHLRPEKLVDAWKHKLLQNGLVIEENSRLIDFEIHRGHIRSINTTKGRFKADAYVIASGAWASEIQEQLKIACPVQPGKGYSITIKKPDTAPLIPCYFHELNIVATPWASGFRLGGTMEFSGFNSRLNKKRLSGLIRGAREYLKTSMDQPVVEEWTGLRPMTFDDLPIIGLAPRTDNLIIATGHGMLGLTTAPGTGKAVCDLLTGDTPEINLAAFSPERFK